MRQVVLDTETTGLEVEQGHRIVEIGCVEIVGRKLTNRVFHQYINPERDIDEGAQDVHGITQDFLQDKPKFADIWDDFFRFVEGAELIIHNASFDLTFIDYEMQLMSPALGRLQEHCTVIDSLEVARHRHPGQRNSLEALCKRYEVDDSGRQFHGALLDAQLLADVYLLLTGGQEALAFDADAHARSEQGDASAEIDSDRPPLRVIKATEEELAAHERKLDRLDETSERGAVWRRG